MNRIIGLMLLAVAICSGQETALTGYLNTPNGVGINGTLTLSLSQQAAVINGGPGSCPGPVEVVPNYQVRIPVTAGDLISAAVYGNDCMLPQGTYYKVQFVDNQGNVLMTDNWVLTGTSVNIGTIVSTVVSGTTTTLGGPGVLFTVPNLTQTVTQPVGTSLNVNTFGVTGTFTLPNGSVCTSTGCTGTGLTGGSFVTLADPQQTITGSKIFTSDILSEGAALGSTTNPFTYGLFSGTVTTAGVSLILGSPASPSFSYTWNLPVANQLKLVDADSVTDLLFDATGSAPVWSFHGSVTTTDTSVSTLGTNANPWYGLNIKGPVWFQYDGVPTDTFEVDLQMVATNSLTVLGQRRGTGATNFVDLSGTSSLYVPTVTGADITCNSTNRSNFGIRTDTSQLEWCVPGTTTTKKVTLN